MYLYVCVGMYVGMFVWVSLFVSFVQPSLNLIRASLCFPILSLSSHTRVVSNVQGDVVFIIRPFV